MTSHTGLRQGGRKVVLVVDDDKILCELIEEILGESLTCEVMVAQNATRALELLDASRVDLIILDYWLPDIDGLRLYDLLQHNPSYCSIPVLFVTAAAQSLEFQKRNVSGYLTKPFDIDQFVEKVNTLLNGEALPTDLTGI